MKWEICYSARALKFIRKNNLEEKIREIIKKFILRYMGETISIDVKKLKGEWKGYHRIRSGKIRIILKVNKDSQIVYIDAVDFRKNVY
jgi:mRNA interferase RelE/StbE